VDLKIEGVTIDRGRLTMPTPQHGVGEAALPAGEGLADPFLRTHASPNQREHNRTVLGFSRPDQADPFLVTYREVGNAPRHMTMELGCFH